MRIYSLIFVCLIFLIETQPWVSWKEAHQRIRADDYYTYKTISDAAPEVSKKLIAPQHGQRFVMPYLLGIISKATNIPLQSCYQWTSLFLLLLLLYFINLTITSLKLSPITHTLTLGIYILSPYALRYYLLAQGLVPDILFVATLPLLLFGLINGHFFIVLFSLIFATIGRQNAITLTPIAALCIYFGSTWKLHQPKKRLLYATTVVLLPVLCFYIFSKVGNFYSYPKEINSQRGLSYLVGYVFSIIPWIFSDKFSLSFLGEHIARSTIPLWMTIAITIGVYSSLEKKLKLQFLKNQNVWLCVFFVLMLSGLPILTSPVIANGSQARYGAYGIFPMICILGFLCKPLKPTRVRKASFYTLLVLLALSSFHHLNTRIGPSSALNFMQIQLFFSIMAGLLSTKLFYRMSP